MQVLSLNCQRGYQSGLAGFLSHLLEKGDYDILVFQEVDGKVLSFLKNPSYILVRAFNEETEEESQLCIAYRRTYSLERTGFKSFASMRKDSWHGYKHPGFGLLWADLNVDDRSFRICSVHLHSGINQEARTAELKIVKELVLKDSGCPIVLAGDYNAGYPGEASRMARALVPELIWQTRKIGPTLDSRYSEKVQHLPSLAASFLRVFNLKILLRTDHVYVDSKALSKYKISVRLLSDRVSDHSPVEIKLEPIQID